PFPHAFFGLALLAAAAFPAGLSAQTVAADAPPAKEESVKLEAFTVTGSNIKRLDQENVLPVTLIDRDALTLRDASTPVELLTMLPSNTSVPLNETTAGGANARGDNANVNLRGIGSSNTLILINGRRTAPNPMASADGSGMLAFSVNVNQLPNQGIDHIDVLRDGASSIYGSDAVAGVINYITQKNFLGTEVHTRVAMPEHGAGRSYEGAITYGREFADGKGRWVSTFDFLHREPIYLSERDFTVSADHSAQAPAPFNVAGSVFDGRSTTSTYPSFRVGTGTATNYFRLVNGTPALTSVAPTRAANPEYYLNGNAYSDLGQDRTNRANWFNTVEYDLTSRITAFADLSFYRAVTSFARIPLPFNAPSADSLATISADNPFNPYGSSFYSPTGAPNADGTPRLTGTPKALTLLTHTLQDNGQEHVQVTNTLSRMVGGLRGKIGNDWSWETGALYTRDAATDISKNAVRESLFDAALLRTDKTAYNPFGYTFKVANGAVVADQPYTNPQSVINTFVDQWERNGFSSIGSLDLRAAGPLFHYWGNTVSLAAGAEYRKEEFIDHRPPFAGLNPASSGLNPLDNDFIQASPKPDSAGDRTVASAYAETVVPVVSPSKHFPLVYSFEATGSARFEHYSDFGNTTRPKVGVNWKPFRGLMIRGSFNEGFSAPTLPTLYAPSQYTVDSAPGQVDAYRNPVVPGAYVMKNYTMGNPNLKPVTAIGKSCGFVLDVPRVKGLTLSADYWQIDQENVISTYSTPQILNSDAALLNAYVQQQLAAGQSVNSIDLGSGTANYKGDPGVTRFPVSANDIAAFAAYNAAHPTAPLPVVGPIAARSTAYQNLAKGYASGVDLNLTYQLPALPLGRFALNMDWNYLIQTYQIRNISGAAPLFIERMNVDGTTRWRGTSGITWTKGHWHAGLSAYYIGPYADSAATTTAALYTSLGAPAYLSKQFDSGGYLYRYVVSDTITYNTFASYHFPASANRWLRNTTVRVGIVNLTDKVPPLASGAFGYSTAVYGNLFAGRTWTLELTRHF
ncbi:MAG: TonB-dependent receptor domain-containing protein, partial [Opitutales bacterium]